jgi:hypothetical protein
MNIVEIGALVELTKDERVCLRRIAEETYAIECRSPERHRLHQMDLQRGNERFCKHPESLFRITHRIERNIKGVS